MSPVRARLEAAQVAARHQAARDGWRPDRGNGPHPVFAALASEALAILSDHSIPVTYSQVRTLANLAHDGVDPLADIVELVVGAWRP